MTIFETIRARINFSNVAQRYTDFRRSGNRLLGRCPLPNHDDTSPSFFVYPDDHAHCYGCGFHGDVIDLWAALKGLQPGIEAALDLAREFGVQLPDRDPEEQKKANERRTKEADYARQAEEYHQALSSHPNVVAYLEQRGFNHDLRRRFLLGADHDGSAVVIPFWHQGRIQGFIRRRLNDKPKYMLPTVEGFPSGYKPLFIPGSTHGDLHKVEGPFDALVLAALNLSAIAVGGTGISRQQREELQKYQGTIYIFPDADEEGAKAAHESVKELYPRARLCPAEYGKKADGTDCKDVADLLEAKGDEAKQVLEDLKAHAVDALDLATSDVIKAGNRERDTLIRALIQNFLGSADALVVGNIGKALKEAKVLSLTTWRELVKQERERQKQQKQVLTQTQDNARREARLQELISVKSDLLKIHETLTQATSSPHSHDVIELSIATSISHLLRDLPLLWLLIVGPPSSDKTQTALAAKDAPHIFHLDTMTENAFISGFLSPDGSPTQDLLAELDGRCLTIKDLNALFGQHHEKVAKVLGDMTAIYDGEFAKWTGTRGNVSYAARFSLIGCVTPLTLAEHHRYMNMIGARFLNYRVAELNSESVRDGFNAVWNGQVTAKTRLRQFASAYATQLHQKLSRGELTIPTFNDCSKVSLNTLAQFLACGRAAVRTQRAGITNDSGKTTTVYNIAEVQREEPFRALLQLRSLATALAIVHGRKEVSEHELELCRRVVLSSMPYDRSLILSLFQDSRHLNDDGGLTRTAAAEGIGRARNQAIRLLTELKAIGVLKAEKSRDSAQNVDVWTYYPATDEFSRILSLATQPLAGC